MADGLLIQEMTPRLSMMIESLVDYMGTSMDSSGRSLHRYDGAIPFLPEFLNGGVSLRSHESASNDDETSYKSSVAALARIPPPAGMDVSFLVQSRGSAAVKWAAQRVRTLGGRECRGATKIYPHMVESRVAVVRNDATYQEARFYVGWSGGAWHWASPRHHIVHVERQQELNAAIGVMLHQEAHSNWRAVLGYDGSPRVSFVTSPVGVLECFRLRDIPNGKKRRSALVHWVQSHWRKIPSRSECLAAEVEVRNHLRGQRSFTWNGLGCEIVPVCDVNSEVARSST